MVLGHRTGQGNPAWVCKLGPKLITNIVVVNSCYTSTLRYFRSIFTTTWQLLWTLHQFTTSALSPEDICGPGTVLSEMGIS